MKKRIRKKPPIHKPIEFTDKHWLEFEELCALQCTQIEVCAWFKITDKTLTRLLKIKYNLPFSEVFRQKRSKGLISLRRRQFQLAQSNPAMAIFLGKNYLNQRDKQEIEHSISDVRAIKSEIEKIFEM